MGRFNYTNRRIDGVKLGQVVAKDLTKRIPPALGSKAAFRDPVVEIDLTSKRLTDVGLLEVTAGLAKSVQSVTPPGRVVLLEELCLKDNGLTAASLSGLTSVIDLVCEDLRDLDLSDNAISINEPDDVIFWVAFLESVSKCCVLRRLDLSGNKLGTKAFEMLARVYAREGPIDASFSEGLDDLSLDVLKEHVASPEPMALQTVHISESNKNDSAGDYRNRAIPRFSEVSRFVPNSDRRSSSLEKCGLETIRREQIAFYSRTKGLRSVPYVVLSDTSMNDASALYLSFIIVDHLLPARLLSWVPPAKAGFEQQRLLTYDEQQCRGVIYLPNDGMTKNGVRVLNLAEKERLRLIEPLSPDSSSEDLVDPIKVTETLEDTPGSSRSSGLITARIHRRRTSGSVGGYLGSPGTPAKSMNELERARSRIEGQELEKTGQSGNDLWRISLKMLCLCREIQLRCDPEPLQAAEWLLRAGPDPDAASSSKALSASEFSPLLPPSRPGGPKPKAPIIKTLQIPGYLSKKIDPMAPVLPLRIGNPNQAMCPKSVHKPKLSTVVAPVTLTVVPPTPLPTSDESKIAIAVARAKAKPYRSQLPCGLSQMIWCRILGQVAGAKGILSRTQQKSVLAWAMDRNTLRRGREWLCEKEGNQIWHVLDGMGCLAYEADEKTDTRETDHQ